MIRIRYKGRLGNRMIQLAAAHVLSKKTGISLSTHPVWNYNNTHRYKTTCSPDKSVSISFIDTFKIKLLSGKSYTNSFNLDDSNYYEHLDYPLLNTGYLLNGYFQDSRLLCNYRNDITKLYQFHEPPKIKINQKDCFIHARIGDLLNNSNRDMAYFNPVYLDKELQATRNNFNKVYISSDTIDYPPLVKLINQYGLSVYQTEPLDTILFAKNFNNLILSAGSFSYWMAYLSKASNITVYGNKIQDPLQRHNAWNYNQNIKFKI